MLTFEIAVQLRKKPEGRLWRITEPYLKLALKYGVMGPWHHEPWSLINRSVAFDAYSMSRGPECGLPDLGDFTATLMMGSGVTADHLARFLRWRGLPETVRDLEEIRSALVGAEGLHDLPLDAVQLLGEFTDRAIRDSHRLKEISVARVFKWLAAWAPRHVPMIDSAVYEALIGSMPADSIVPSFLLLERFRDLLLKHLDVLRDLAKRIAADYPEHFPVPVPQVRVLDSLLWFDWEAVYTKEKGFREYVAECTKGDDHHQVTPLGRQFLVEHGF